MTCPYCDDGGVRPVAAMTVGGITAIIPAPCSHKPLRSAVPTKAASKPMQLRVIENGQERMVSRALITHFDFDGPPSVA
jgi:hypothetical protein